MRILSAILLFLFAFPALAETLTWTPPTERVDGAPLDPATEIAEYRLICGTVTTSIDSTVPEGNQHEVRKHESLPGYGSHDCALVVVDTDGLESEPSNSVVVEWQKSAPVAPTDLLLIVDN